jgi:hypothetical protein
VTDADAPNVLWIVPDQHRPDWLGAAGHREIFSREDTPTEQRILGAFLYYAGLSYSKVERFVDRSYEAADSGTTV